MPATLSKPFAVGRTAEVYAWEDGSVLKLYREGFPLEWVDHEAYIGRLVVQAGVPAPEVRDILEVEGRRGILYERVDGPDMLAVINRSPFKLLACARSLGQLHVQMHRCAADLPSQRGMIERAIHSAPALPDDLRACALAALAALPDSDRLCHGDFHPGNVILTRRGPIVIDWMTANQGHPAADLARTRLVLTIGRPPGKDTSQLHRLLAITGRGLLVGEYLRAYRAAEPEVVRLSDAFLPVQAAARLNEQIAHEREKLVEIIRRGIKK
jgi:uncharacterized protein (TIGR02172 family)